MSSTSNKLVYGSLILGTCAILCLAIVAQARYNTFDSDSNSDSDGNPILTQSELGKLVRNSANTQARHANNHHSQQHAAATRNLYNRQQPLQYAPTQNRRNYGSADNLNGYGPVMGAASGGRGSNANSDADDDDSSSYGPNFGANFDNDNNNDGENSNVNGDGPALSLNQAASGYPGQGDYSNDASGAGFGFGAQSGYGPSADGSDFGPSEGFGSDGRRAKSASSLSGMRNFGTDDDAGAPQYGPNSAVNSGDRDGDDEGRAGYAPESQNDNENDEE